MATEIRSYVHRADDLPVGTFLISPAKQLFEVRADRTETISGHARLRVLLENCSTLKTHWVDVDLLVGYRVLELPAT